MSTLNTLTITEVLEGYKKKEFTPQEVLDDVTKAMVQIVEDIHKLYDEFVLNSRSVSIVIYNY